MNDGWRLLTGAAFYAGALAGLLPGDVSISGQVSDASGAPVPNVVILLKAAGSSEISSAQTNDSGEFRFLRLPPGSYGLCYESPGFRREVKEVTARKDTDVGTLVLAVAAGGGPMMEPSAGRSHRLPTSRDTAALGREEG